MMPPLRDDTGASAEPRLAPGASYATRGRVRPHISIHYEILRTRVCHEV